MELDSNDDLSNFARQVLHKNNPMQLIKKKIGFEQQFSKWIIRSLLGQCNRIHLRHDSTWFLYEFRCLLIKNFFLLFRRYVLLLEKEKNFFLEIVLIALPKKKSRSKYSKSTINEIRSDFLCSQYFFYTIISRRNYFKRIYCLKLFILKMCTILNYFEIR